MSIQSCYHFPVISWALYYMCRNPEVQEKVHEEVEKVLSGNDVTLDKIVYLK